MTKTQCIAVRETEREYELTPLPEAENSRRQKQKIVGISSYPENFLQKMHF